MQGRVRHGLGPAEGDGKPILRYTMSLLTTSGVYWSKEGYL